VRIPGDDNVPRRMPEISEQQGTLDAQPTFWLQAPPTGAAPVVYVHGVPTSSEDWRPFLARTGGIAPDLPGFGRAGKRGDLPCTIDFYGEWLERFLDQQGVERFSLLVHDWGAVGLATAQRLADRVERLVVMDAVPLLPGYRWHRIARAWRTPLLGEAAMGALIRPVTSVVLREAFTGKVPAGFVDDVMRFLDGGTQRSILKLYRASPPGVLAAAGADLGALTCPALVVWGDRDPYIKPRFAEAYAAALGGAAEVVHLPDAGHWPWHDRPDVVETVARFLGT
jgi:pimeloyl-ACP methyl ester carboxylesterase